MLGWREAVEEMMRSSVKGGISLDEWKPTVEGVRRHYFKEIPKHSALFQ